MTEKKFIEVEKIIAEKNPGLLKWLPGFILRWIKRVLHEEEVNAFMSVHGQLRDFDFIRQVTGEFGVKIVVKGLENIPREGGFILASNHPLGGFDGLALMQALEPARKDIRFLVNDILLAFGTMDNLFIPINKHGAQGAADKIEAAYASDNAVLIFPAGLVSRKQKGIVRDLEWKKSFISKAVQHKKNIIPTHIEGSNSKFFYNLALWRKRLGIKANIEMFWLMDEMYKQRDKTITIIFGKAIPYTTFDKRHSPRGWAQQVKKFVYALGSGKATVFEPDFQKNHDE